MACTSLAFAPSIRGVVVSHAGVRSARRLNNNNNDTLIGSRPFPRRITDGRRAATTVAAAAAVRAEEDTSGDSIGGAVQLFESS
jgi:hypothetical protein